MKKIDRYDKTANVLNNANSTHYTQLLENIRNSDEIRNG